MCFALMRAPVVSSPGAAPPSTPPRCTAKCMQKWGKYSETNNLVVKRRGEASRVPLSPAV